MSRLETRNIKKIYPGTVALNDVSLSFESGKVHALVGKNGSGKSTMLKILSGAIQPTEGEVILDGELLKFKSPIDAFSKGIATVYQELSLMPDLSVAENVLIGRLPRRGKLIDWKTAYARTDELLKELEIDIPADAIVRNLSMWQCQMIEIAKAMSFHPKVLQLDEPTSSLAKHEVESLFRMVRKLREKDVIILYVSHKLHELWQIADTCTVLRDGQYVGCIPMKDTSHKQLIDMMFGDVVIQERPKDLKFSDEVMLEVKNLSRRNKFQDISFSLHKGEVLGIAGMLGSGRTELLKSIFGADPIDSGEIYIEGKKVHSPTLKKMKNAGVALTPEDRKNEGLNLIGSVKDNLCYASLKKIAGRFFINRKKENECIHTQIANLQIKVPSIEDPVSSLSGGNQQKVVVGNWLNTAPKVMLFDEPSRGIDVNAKQQIFQIIWDQSRKGISSIMVSTELEELLSVCHRILIMRNGRIEHEVVPESLKIDELYSLCMGGK